MSQDYPILAYIRSKNKFSDGNTYSYRIKFNFNYNCNKFHYLKMKLINIIYPLTISSGSSSETFYYAEFRMIGLNFMSNCDTNNNNITVGLLFNSQYSKSGNLYLTTNSQNSPYFVIENPIDK